MNRKEFLHSVGGCCAALASLQAAKASVESATTAPSTSPVQSTTDGTPLNDRMNFAMRWARRMLDNMDRELDAPTCKRLLQANGRVCFEGSKIPVPANIGIDAFVAAMTKAIGGGKQSPIRREGDIVYFDYVGNPLTGLKIADGWCLCPLVEKGPEGLSGTYCECSVGYVKAMFEHISGKPVRVELLESLKRDGKGCRFKIHLETA